MQKLNPALFMNQQEVYEPKGTLANSNIENNKFHFQEFEEMYSADKLDIKELRKKSWAGIPKSNDLQTEFFICDKFYDFTLKFCLKNVT